MFDFLPWWLLFGVGFFLGWVVFEKPTFVKRFQEWVVTKLGYGS